MISAIRSGDPQEIIITIGVYLMIILLITPIHECAHAWAAKKLGDDTASLQGRITLNPIAHMDPIGTILMVLVGFGWGKPVPINPLRFKGNMRKGVALTALAGPLSNIIAAIIGITVSKFSWYAWYSGNMSAILAGGKPVTAAYWLYMIFQVFASVNVGLAVFNMIPIPPLDGQKVLSYFTSKKFDRFFYQNQMLLTLALFALLNTPVPGMLRNLVYTGLYKLTFFVDIIAKAVFHLS
ncbi:MAG: site-2 protease family protein [Ruminococcus sp.]|nr:site-2 protease family protein [Ruminococcus sp.]